MGEKKYDRGALKAYCTICRLLNSRISTSYALKPWSLTVINKKRFIARGQNQLRIVFKK